MSVIEELIALEDRLPHAGSAFEDRAIAAAISAHPPRRRNRRRWVLGLSLAAALLVATVVGAGLLRSHTKPPPPGHPAPAPVKTFRHPGEVAMPVRGVGIVGIDPKTGSRRILAPCTAPCVAVDDPIWSANGQFLMFREFHRDPALKVPVSGPYLVGSGQAAAPVVIPGLDFVEFAAWSPRDATIAVSGGRKGHAEIWLVDAATLRATAFARTIGPTFAETMAVWSPDGGAIAYSVDLSVFSGEPAEGQVLVVQPLDGQPHAVTMLRRERGAIWPTWSPNGRHLLANGAIVDAQAPSPTATPTGHALDGAAWSPDGTLIASRSGPTLNVSGPDGTRVVTIRLPVTWGRAGSWPAVWSPDGRQLAVPTQDGTFLVQADGRGAPRLMSSHDAFAWFQRPGVLPVMPFFGDPQPDHPFA
jgi:hypothetical protein